MLYICKNVHRADLLLVYKTTLLAYKHCFISFKTACLTRSESKIQTAVISFLKILKTSTLFENNCTGFTLKDENCFFIITYTIMNDINIIIA